MLKYSLLFIHHLFQPTINSIGKSPITSQFNSMDSPFLTLTLINLDSKKGGTTKKN